MPSAAELFREQRELVTPRRTSYFQGGRDSILDSSEFGAALVSPATLKSNLPSQKMDAQAESTIEEEKTTASLEGGASMQSSNKENGGK